MTSTTAELIERSTEPIVLARWARRCEGGTVPGATRTRGALPSIRDSRELLARIGVPTLVVGGAEDALTPPDVMQALADGIPGARFVAIPAAGHLAPLEQPLAVNRALSDFLDALPADD